MTTPASPRLMVPSCSLNEAGLRAQRERYRRLGAGAAVVEHTTRQLIVNLSESLGGEEIEELIVTERRCCPFFDLDWTPEARRLTIAVSRDEDEAALEAIAFALGLD
jgi:hypothetical protein